ncbi:vesicle-associated membrane protein-associated protein B-like isoform X2 [Pieris brassicae]|uniref:vesicle-associated membrane protein-associated protein B-like isoform X2 n=1 Tax=Pieris brassicae TaxID=7116 RepID=UPI001E65F380|nr:vesicle-associated membrane protein-associated protein B-like isoform X2 [Pieris brassicae]
MPNQVLIIEPQNELKFKVNLSGLFDQGHTTHMKLTNPTSNTVLFKIKTTAPKKYYVRPNSGVLEPNAKVDIAITPQHFYVDPNETHKHKFMVQSVIAPDNKTNIDQVWKETHPNQLMDYKLRCVFVSPREGNTNDAGDTAAQNEVTKKLVAVAEEGKPPAPQSVSKEELVSVTKSMKAIDEEEKADDSVRITAFSKSENVENDMQKVSSEVIHLREEESKLRHENLRLKEELLRLHQQVGGEHMAQRGHSYAPDRKEQLSVPWLGITLAMALLGIIIGKFFM